MPTEIRAIRKITPQADGDTVHVAKFNVYRNGRIFKAWKPKKKSLTGAGLLKIRLLGIDTPELHYPGPSPPTPCPNRLTGPARPKIPPQDPWGTDAKVWLDKQLGDGDRVIVELDAEVFDKYGRVLGYIWTVKGNWKKNKLLNVRLVEQGLAFPYQIWPNRAHFSDVKEAAKVAKGRGVFVAVADKLLTLNQVRAGGQLNEPFLYRKVVDGAICQVSPRSLLHRWVGDARTWLYYNPQQYRKVPIPYRFFFEDEKAAINAGFSKA